MLHSLEHFVSTLEKNTIFRVLSLLLVTLIGIYLIRSVVTSGYYYIFDNDELYHTQVTYLLSNGYKPFTDIYLTVYPPLYHWFIQPLFTIGGFSFDTMYQARILMIGLFLLRVVLLGIFAYLLFGKRVGLLAPILLLLSPFAVFAEMQMRPDNLMLTVFLTGLVISTYAWKSGKTIAYILGSFFIMLSLLILMKIFPSVVMFFFVSFVWLLKERKWNQIAGIGTGILAAWLLYLFPFLISNTFTEMIQQVFVESFSSYSGVFEYPVPLGFFYRPGNPALYGLPGKPVNWIFSWIVLIGSGAGIFHLFEQFFEIKTKWKKPILFIVLLSFLGQFAFLFLVESVFIQHYITVNWLFALLTAVVCIYVFRYAQKIPLGTVTYASFLIVALVILIVQSSKANYARSTIRSDELVYRLSAIWSLIPENESVFPNILFRRLGYPVPAGHFIGNMPESILNRLPSIPVSLVRNNTKYVYIDTYYFERIPHEAQQYIQSMYSVSQQDPQLYIRK